MIKEDANIRNGKVRLISGSKKITPEYKEIPPRDVFLEFWSNARSQKRSFLFMLIFMLLQGAVVGGSIWMVKSSLDLFFEDKDPASVFFLIGALFVATVGRSTMEFFFNWKKTFVIGRIRDVLVVKAFRDLIYNPFHIHIKERDRKKYGWVLTDAMGFIESIFGIINSWIKQPFIVISTIGALCAIAPLLTLIGIALIPLGIPSIIFLKRRIKEFIAQRKHLIGLVEEVVSESIRCIRIVKVFGLEASEIQKLQRTVNRQRDLNQKNTFYAGLISPISELLGFIGLTVIIFIGSQYIHSGTFTTGTFFVFIMSFINIYRPLKQISNGIINYQMALDSGRRLIILRKNALKEQKKTGTVKIGHFRELRIENLWFSYSEKIESDTDFVLRDLNLTIRKGESVAIVGATGVGKSTLCDLIFRLYEQQRGNIYVNGVLVEHIENQVFKEKFALCSQETIVFNNTLLEDIRIARPDASREEVMAVAEVVGLSSFMNSLNRGLDTWIGDRGVQCSGGQRQMIALARAILQKPEVLVLDEAISGIDVETGEKIWQNIREWLPGCTILIASHHLHIIKHCNRIVLLKQGQIIKDSPVGDISEIEQFFSEFRQQKKQS